MHYDLIIIGMGLSGLMAAKTAVEEGEKVLIVGKGMGSLGLFSNSIDVLGIIPETMKVSDALSRWTKDQADHPYAKLGWDRIEEALSSFCSLFPPPYSFESDEGRNSLIPTAAGRFRPTYLVPTTMKPGVNFQPERTLIVGFQGLKDFYTQYVGDQLKCRSITLSLPQVSGREITPRALARQMEKEPFRKNLIRRIKKELGDANWIGSPAVLGIHSVVQVKEALEKALDAQIFEIPMLPPSIPGIRIFNRFKKWLIGRNVTFLSGYSVSKAIVRGRQCKGIEVLRQPVATSYSADHYLLATGRFIGGGLVTDPETISEPLFRLPVFQPPDREAWFQKSFFDPSGHPFHQSGIVTDNSFKPVDEKGVQLLENVSIAGSILAHHDLNSEKSREGIEIATGYWAAKHAVGTRR